MDRLCVVIDEPREDRKKALHDALAAYAVSRDTEVEIRWIKPSAGEAEILSACAEAQAAFVSAGEPERAAWIGGLLYRSNPLCALVYCGGPLSGGARELTAYFSALFPARPALYLDCPGNRDYFRALSAIAAEAAREGLFHWETKGMRYRVPCSAILYFRSQRNYVCLRLKSGEEHAFLGKLSGVEPLLPRGLFLRVHQSFLVNRAEILLVDKGRKALRLSSGEEIFISKAHYKEALAL